jgi:hypothetical protein
MTWHSILLSDSVLHDSIVIAAGGRCRIPLESL